MGGVSRRKLRCARFGWRSNSRSAALPVSASEETSEGRRSLLGVFLEAVDGGLHSVPHAGEMAGPASIRGAAVHLTTERIGHGICILEDPEVVALARERKIALEVCPTSNVTTEYLFAREQFGLNDQTLAGLARAAGVNGSFADPNLKTSINRDIDGVVRSADHVSAATISLPGSVLTTLFSCFESTDSNCDRAYRTFSRKLAGYRVEASGLFQAQSCP